MNFSFRIALRYLFSKSSQTVVNLINIFAVIVLIVSSSALLIVLSGFDGLKEFGMSFYNQFEPDYKIIATKGKTLNIDKKLLDNINRIEGIKSSSVVVEEKVFFSFEEKSQAGYLRGVSPSYAKNKSIDSLIVIGEWIDFDSNSIVLGYGLSSNLGTGVYDYSSYLELSAPKKEKFKFQESPFRTKSSYVSGIFQISEDVDNKYAFSSISLAKELLGFSKNEFSYVSIDANSSSLKKTSVSQLKSLFNVDVLILSRAQQNPALYKMINTENIVIYLIFSLVILIALFNLIGSIMMMTVDKASQLKLIYSLGESPKNIQLIFLYIGILISAIGSIGGVLLASVLIIVQDLYPYVFVPGTSLAYPVALKIKNIIIVLSTVFILGLLTSFFSTRKVQAMID